MGERCKKAPTQNLIDITRYLLESGGVDEAAKDLSEWGADQSVWLQLDEHMDVLPENWDTVRLFQACASQWRHAGMTGAIIGLDYQAVDVVMRRMRFADETFEKLQVMEGAALNYWRANRES